MLATILICLGALVLFCLAYFLAQGAPYVPSSDQNVGDMIRAVESARPQPRIIDLGSGDGKLMLEFAKHGYQVDGVELNPVLVWRARHRILRHNLAGKCRLFRANLWRFDTSDYDIVLLFAVRHIMSRLEAKLTKELRPGALVVSNHFAFPNLNPIRTVGNIKVYKIKN